MDSHISIPLAVTALFAGFAAYRFYKRNFNSVTIYDWQRGLMYSKGKYERTAEAGKYLLYTPNQTCTIVDMRSQAVQIVNQEILCADSLTIKLSCACIFKVADARLAMTESNSYQSALYLDTQMIVREIVTGNTCEEILAKRNSLSEELFAKLKERSAVIGLEIQQAGIRDITFPPDVRKILSQVVNAEKSAQAALAKARAETASLRALANASKMMEDHPALLTLRTLQSLTELSATPGNTVVVGLPQSLIPTNPR